MAAKLTSDERIARMTLSSVYPLYRQKVERKGRGEAELKTILAWFLAVQLEEFDALLAEPISFEALFQNRQLCAETELVGGSICGIRIADIDNELTQKVRRLDKIVDELAQGKALSKIMRKLDV